MDRGPQEAEFRLITRTWIRSCRLRTLCIAPFLPVATRAWLSKISRATLAEECSLISTSLIELALTIAQKEEWCSILPHLTPREINSIWQEVSEEEISTSLSLPSPTLEWRLTSAATATITIVETWPVEMAILPCTPLFLRCLATLREDLSLLSSSKLTTAGWCNLNSQESKCSLQLIRVRVPQGVKCKVQVVSNSTRHQPSPFNPTARWQESRRSGL